MSEPKTADPLVDNVNDMRTVHDMRRLRQCDRCKGVGDHLQMVQAAGQLWHTRCYRVYHGMKGVLALPKAQRMKFRLCDLTRKEMQRLLDAHT